MSVERWAEALNLARTKGWVPPEPKTSLLLVGHTILAECATDLAETLGMVEEENTQGPLAEIVEFCKCGAFMVEPIS
jgi:hypothetical protein